MQLTTTPISFALCTLIGITSCSPLRSPEDLTVREAGPANNLTTTDSPIALRNLDHQSRDAQIDFNRTIPNTGIYVRGTFIASFAHPPSRDPAPFIRNQTIHVLELWNYYHSHHAYHTNDGPLPYDGVWIFTGPDGSDQLPEGPNPPSVWDLGLYVRPVAGQRLTFGTLYNAMRALQGTAQVVGNRAPMLAHSAFTFDVLGADSVLIGQGVLTECEGAPWDCFKPFGLPNV
ncbi:MAG: hypothetical protein M1835_003497 [Candelina submexicana]|nr:MAG: hypothetical protein M1835_003497 [Candelina submexicana]